MVWTHGARLLRDGSTPPAMYRLSFALSRLRDILKPAVGLDMACLGVAWHGKRGAFLYLVSFLIIYGVFSEYNHLGCSR